MNKLIVINPDELKKDIEDCYLLQSDQKEKVCQIIDSKEKFDLERLVDHLASVILSLKNCCSGYVSEPKRTIRIVKKMIDEHYPEDCDGIEVDKQFVRGGYFMLDILYKIIAEEGESSEYR